MKLKRSGILTKLIILALLSYALISFYRMQARLSEAEQTRAELQARADALARSNDTLEYEISHRQDPEAIERIAREKLGLVLPGEIVFYDLSD